MKEELLTREMALSFHDAELRSVEHDRFKSELRITFALSGGNVRAISCRGVHVLRATDIVRQNVTSTVLLSSWHRFPDCDVVAKVNWANSLSDTPIQLGLAAMTKYRQSIASGDWSLLVIEPSCGAEIVVVCDSVAVTDCD